MPDRLQRRHSAVSASPAVPLTRAAPKLLAENGPHYASPSITKSPPNL